MKITKQIILFISYLLLSACSDKEKSQIITVTDAQIEAVISKSDDYEKYKTNLISATKKLVQNNKCNLSEFKNMGGWVKSQNQKKKPIYFTYCGGMKINNRIYLNAGTGKIFR